MTRYNQDFLKRLATDCAKSITDSLDDGKLILDPFKHIIIDNFLPNDVVEKLLNEFPLLKIHHGSGRKMMALRSKHALIGLLNLTYLKV